VAKPNFRKLIKKVNVYPPYLGMGIRVKSVSEDYTRFEVVLRQRWYNRNLFGTHFGGCLYSMCELLNESGEAVARVSKEVYVRARNRT
jgi:hypothetical protein